MDKRTLVKDHLQFLHSALKKILETFDEEESMHQLYDDMNHPRWQTGHMTGSAYAMLRLLGENLQEPEDTEKLFGSGSQLKKDPTEYPAFSELKDRLYKLWARIYDRLDKVEESLMDEETSFGEWKPTKYEALMFLGAHDFYHAGQLTLTMRSLGKERPFS